MAETTAVETISLDTFWATYSQREDPYKYEWVHGRVLQSPAMNQGEAFIQAVLQRLFFQTATGQAGGLLAVEADMFTAPEQLRRPDLAIYTAEQLQRMQQGEYQLARWVAEVISSNDNFNRVVAKVSEYFEAGVAVVWLVIPATSQVYVYTDPSQAEICQGEMVCSAAPAFPDFEITAQSLFHKA